MIDQNIAGTSARRALAVAALRLMAVALLTLASHGVANAQPIAMAAIGDDAKQSCTAGPTEYSDELTANKLAQKATLTYDITGAVYPHYKCVDTGYTLVSTKVSWGEETYTITVADQNGGTLFTDTVNANIQKYEECQSQTALLHPPPINKHIVRHIDISGLTANSVAGLILSVTGCNTHSTQALSALFNPVPESNIYATLEAPGVPAFVFNQTVSPQKVLTWIDPADLDVNQEPNYPSADQRKPDNDFAGVPLGDKPQMFIRGTTNVKAGGRVWLKLIDPPDSAPYVIAPSPPVPDNADGSAKIYNAEGVSRRAGNSLPVTVGTTGNVDVILEGAQNDAGDNYRVIASVDKPDANDVFPCETAGNCPQSVEIVVWKRLYVENARMAMQGAFLAVPVVGGTDPCSTANPCVISLRDVHVEGTQVINPATSLTIMGMGPPGDTNAPYHEVVTVDQDSQLGGLAVEHQTDGTWKVRLTSRPTNSYVGNTNALRVLVDSVAVNDQAGGLPAYTVDTTAIRQSLHDAFIEYADAPNYWPYVPYVGTIFPYEEPNLIKRWYKTATRREWPVDKPYHRLLIGASRALAIVVQNSKCGTTLGHTIRSNSSTVGRYRASYVFERTLAGGAVGTLETFYPAHPDVSEKQLPAQCVAAAIDGVYNRPAAPMEQLSAAHEVAHSFGVDYGSRSGDGAGHCAFNDYLGTGLCLENPKGPPGFTLGQLNSGSALLHYVVNTDGTIDSEYMEMRKLHERIP